MLSKVVIAAFLATSAVALEVKSTGCRGDQDQCGATTAAPATAPPLGLVMTSTSHGGALASDVFA